MFQFLCVKGNNNDDYDDNDGKMVVMTMMMKRRRKAEVNVLMILLCIQPTKQNQTAKKSKDKHLKSVISGALLNTTQYMSRSTPRRYR